MKPPRIHLIACPVFQRELELVCHENHGRIVTQLLEMGLHEGAGENLRVALQKAIDGVPAGECDYIAVAYGLCNCGVVGLQSRAVPVVIPRAHDCISMLLGGSQRYLEQLEAQPGTYFQSAGWLEHSPANGEIRQQMMTFGPATSATRAELVQKYGEDNADYLLKQFTNFTRHYQRLTFIATPVPEKERWERNAQELARRRNWKFERVPGELGWLRRLVHGPWSEQEFLVLNPGQRVVRSSDTLLIRAEPA